MATTFTGEIINTPNSQDNTYSYVLNVNGVKGEPVGRFINRKDCVIALDQELVRKGYQMLKK